MLTCLLHLSQVKSLKFFFLNINTNMKIMQITEYKRPKVTGKITEPISTSVDQVMQQGLRYSCLVSAQLIPKLNELGWQKIGMGCFSVVFSKPNLPYVLKVNRRPDTAFQRYVELIQRFPNRHFPKIGDIKQINFHEKRYYIYTIEKLYKITSIPSEIGPDRVANFLEKITDYPDLPVTELLEDWRFSTREFKKWAASQPSLIKACQFLGHNAPHAGIDLHAGNIMQRRDGTIVIADPFAFYQGDPRED